MGNKLEQNLNALLADFIRKGPAGCACQVARRGETLYEGCFGLADVEANRLIGTDTIYRVYSMSKVITCTAALMLYERGLYALNDPLEAYLPEFADPQVVRAAPGGQTRVSPAARSIRVKDLFTMTSGYPYPGTENETGRRMLEAMGDGLNPKAGALRDFTRMLAGMPLAFDPGEHWMYGMSHDILGALVEVLSGKSFGQFLHDEIFLPLGMEDTAFRIGEDRRSRLCGLYDLAPDGTRVPNTGLDGNTMPGARFESGGAGLLSTLGDYTRFAQALACAGACGPALLSPHTLRLMASNHLSARQLADLVWPQLAGYGYGLGVRVLMDPAAGGCAANAGEFGWAGAAGTLVFIDRTEGLSIVYMQQMFPNQEPYHMPRLRDTVYGSL